MELLQSGRFGKYELRYRTEDMGERKPRNIVEALCDGEVAGYLNWRATSGIVDWIEVVPGHRRRGVATAMWDFAQSLRRVRKPTDNGDYSRDGRAWAQARRRVRR